MKFFLTDINQEKERLSLINFLFISAALFLVQGNLPYFLRFPETSWAWSPIPEFPPASQMAEALEKGGLSGLSRQLGLILLCCWGIFGLFRVKWQQIRIKGLLGWLIIFFLFWVLISVAWSEEIPVSFRKVLVLGGFWLAAAVFAARFTFRKIIKFALFSSGLLLTLGVLAEVIRGRFHPFPSIWGYWFIGEMHPSTQPQVCGILLISAMVLIWQAAGRSWFYYTIAIVALLFLFLTHSRTYLYGSLLVGSVFWIMATPSGDRLRHAIWYLLGFLAFLCLFYFIVGDKLVNMGKTSFLMGRDPASVSTLSGRFDLWQICIDQAMESPLLGHGYGSFVGAKGMLKIAERLGWGAPNPHNGYIELLLEVGLIGTMVYLLILILALKNSFRSLMDSGSPHGGFAFCMLLLYSFAMIFLGFPPSYQLFIVFTYLSKYAFVVEHIKKKQPITSR